ncbi:Gfo/Idh/MocA family protein [Agarivorans sp. MS3-6]
MSTEMFNWGVIAPGRIARNFAEGLAVIPDACLYAVASSNLDRAKAFAADFSAQHAMDDYQCLVNDPAVDAIYIANPHRFHFDSIKMCLEAGKAVLCEKPLTVTAKQSQQLVDIAQQNNVFLMEALWSRFQPAWQQVRRWLDEKCIGDIKLINSSFGFNIPRDETDRLLNLELAGGSLLDMGVYNVSLSQFVMGDNPVSVLADGHVGVTGVDERTTAILRYPAAVSQFTCNFLADTANDFTIYGTKGRITIPSMFWVATKASICISGEVEKTIDFPFKASGFEYQIEEVMRCVRNGKLQSEVISWNDSVATMQVMDEILNQVGVSYPFVASGD